MATKKRAAPEPRTDLLRSVAVEVHCAFDAEDATPAVQVELVDGCLEHAKQRGLDADLLGPGLRCAMSRLTRENALVFTTGTGSVRIKPKGHLHDD